MEQADLQQELSVLMVGLPSATYLVASRRIRGRCLFHNNNTVTRLAEALSSTIQGQHAPRYQRNGTAAGIPWNDSSEAVLIHLRNATWRKKNHNKTNNHELSQNVQYKRTMAGRVREKKKYLIKTQTGTSQHCIKNKAWWADTCMHFYPNPTELEIKFSESGSKQKLIKATCAWKQHKLYWCFTTWLELRPCHN